MSDRKEPTISGIRPEQDEIAARQRNQSNSRRASPTGGVASRPVIVRSKLAPFAFLIGLTGLGLAGFVYWQFMQTQDVLATAEERIQALEGQLEMSDDESTASLAAVQAKLKWADSEIRKLWGVSYDTNRGRITENKENIATISKKVSNFDKKIEQAVGAANTEMQVLNDLVEAQQVSLSEIEEQQSNLRTQVQALADKLNLLESTQTQLQRQVKTNQEAVESIDTFRRQVNRDLMQLKSGGTAP